MSIIDIKASKEEVLDSGGNSDQPEALEPTNPLTVAVNKLVEASEQLLADVLEEKPLKTSKDRVFKRALDLGIEIVKRKGTDSAETDQE